MNTTKILILVLVIIVVIILAITAVGSYSKQKSNQAVSVHEPPLKNEGYVDYLIYDRYKQNRVVANDASYYGTSYELIRADRDYYVVFPVSEDTRRKMSNYLASSFTMNYYPITNTVSNTSSTSSTMLLCVFDTQVRKYLSFVYPLLFTGETYNASKGSLAIKTTALNLSRDKNYVQTSLSKQANYGYSFSYVTTRKVYTFRTQANILGDIYPLSSMDHDSEINPYDDITPDKKYYSARVRNSVDFEQNSYNYDIGPFKVEINKCVPITYHSYVSSNRVYSMDTEQAIKRVYSHPQPNEGCSVGVGGNNNCYPSRYMADYAILKPKLSINNIIFFTNNGPITGSYTNTKSTPKYSNMDGTSGNTYPSAMNYYNSNNMHKTATTLLHSQSIEFPSGIKHVCGISPTILLNPYIPVKKSGSTVIVNPEWSTTDIKKRKKWYEDCLRGKVRCSAQSRLAANAGTIAYVLDTNGHILWAEPLRFFNLQRNLGDGKDTFPETYQYPNRPNGKTGDKERRPPQSYGNIREGFFNQSFPILAPISILRDYVKISDPSILKNTKLNLAKSAYGKTPQFLVSLRTTNNVFFDLSRTVPDTGVYDFTTQKLDGNLVKASDETADNTKVFNASIGGYVITNLIDTCFDLADSSFTDFTNRTFNLTGLDIGTHKLISKEIAKGSIKYQDYILNSYTHNYYNPWVANHRTKYLVVENCTGNTECMISLNLKVKKYTSSNMDPAATVDVNPTEMFCYYTTDAYGKSYDHNKAGNSDNGMPMAKLLDIGYTYPSYNSFPGSKNNWGDYPLIGYHSADSAVGWTKDSSLYPPGVGGIGFDDYMTRLTAGSSQIVHNAATLLAHRRGTSNKAVIVVFNEPVFLHSVYWVSRVVPKNVGDTFEKQATSGFNTVDKDVTFRNNNYVTLYNDSTHCISSYIMNDSLITTSNTGMASAAASNVSNDFHTNVLNYATFGPTTMLERSDEYNIFPL